VPVKRSGAAIVFAATLGLAQAQTATEKPPQFEVVVIKPSLGGRGQGLQPYPGGRIAITDLNVKRLITVAYGVRDAQIIGGPKWMATDGYDIAGKADTKVTTADRLKLLLQSLLSDRFKLAVHYETKELPVYEMTIARGGLKMQRTKDGSCIPVDFNSMGPPIPGQPRPNFCGRIAPGRRTLSGVGGTAADLASALSMILDRSVIDKSGLSGIFDFKMEWTLDPLMPQLPSASAPGDTIKPPPSAGDEGPSIFTALQEQLGLKLEPPEGQ
jgi:uncharacterized protein (TIGR03435 family)